MNIQTENGEGMMSEENVGEGCKPTPKPEDCAHSAAFKDYDENGIRIAICPTCGDIWHY